MSSAENTIILYHGTSARLAREIAMVGAVIGTEFLKRPADMRGMTLTPNKEIARSFAIHKREKNGIIIAFAVRPDFIATRARINCFDAEEVSTIDTIKAQNLPYPYLAQLVLEGNFMSREEAIEREKDGYVRFYQMPFDYLLRSETELL